MHTCYFFGIYEAQHYDEYHPVAAFQTVAVPIPPSFLVLYLDPGHMHCGLKARIPAMVRLWRITKSNQPLVLQLAHVR